MENPILIATLFMVVLLLGGVHVCVALGLGTLLGFWLGDLPLSFFVERCYTNFESVPLLAVPFFLLVGEIMGRGTMAAGLLRFCRACCGHMKGAMVWVTVFTNLIFGALCGSPVAALVAVGGHYDARTGGGRLFQGICGYPLRRLLHVVGHDSSFRTSHSLWLSYRHFGNSAFRVLHCARLFYSWSSYCLWTLLCLHV